MQSSGPKEKPNGFRAPNMTDLLAAGTTTGSTEMHAAPAMAVRERTDGRTTSNGAENAIAANAKKRVHLLYCFVI